MEKGTAKLLIEGMIIMEYNEFKASLLEELGDFYGKDAAPVISLGDLYKCYVEGNICMDECAGRIIDGRENI